MRISDWSSDVCSSDLGPEWKGHRSTDKRYAGDNRLMIPKSSYRRNRLAPRCRLITSWGWSRSQGFGCSPIKVVRELGSERRETVWSLSRSEEHTSELQSLMRISYAVFCLKKQIIYYSNRSLSTH